MSLESPTKKIEQEQDPIEKMGNMALAREGKLPDHSRRAFRLSTALALFLAIGAFGGKAEAQVRGIGPQGGVVRGIITRVVERGVFSATRAMDKRRANQKEQLESEYQEAMHTLKTMRSQAYQDRYVKNKINQAEYELRKAETEGRMAAVEEAYQQELRKKKGFRPGFFDHILRGIQGY